MMTLAESSEFSQASEPMRYRYFVAAPMSGLNAEEYPDFRRWVMGVVDHLESDGDPVYFAGRKIEQSSDFNSPKYAAVHDLEAIKTSDEFVLIYPRQCNTSAIFEVGVAVGLGLKVTIFTSNRNELVFMLRNTEAFAVLDWANTVKIIEYGDRLPVASTIGKHL